MSSTNVSTTQICYSASTVNFTDQSVVCCEETVDQSKTSIKYLARQLEAEQRNWQLVITTQIYNVRQPLCDSKDTTECKRCFVLSTILTRKHYEAGIPEFINNDKATARGTVVQRYQTCQIDGVSKTQRFQSINP